MGEIILIKQKEEKERKKKVMLKSERRMNIIPILQIIDFKSPLSRNRFQ